MAKGTAPAMLTAKVVGPVEKAARCRRPERMASISAELDCTAKKIVFLPTHCVRWPMKGWNSFS